jgi:hypothetical protein
VTDSTAARLEVPLLALIKRRDPTFFKDRTKVTEYEFQRRVFTADPTTRGAYAEVTGPDDIFQDATPDIGALTDVFQET